MSSNNNHTTDVISTNNNNFHTNNCMNANNGMFCAGEEAAGSRRVC